MQNRWHSVIFPEDDELEEEIDMMPNGNNDILTDEIMKKPSLNIDIDDKINSDEEFKDEVKIQSENISSPITSHSAWPINTQKLIQLIQLRILRLHLEKGRDQMT